MFDSQPVGPPRTDHALDANDLLRPRLRASGSAATREAGGAATHEVGGAATQEVDGAGTREVGSNRGPEDVGEGARRARSRRVCVKDRPQKMDDRGGSARPACSSGLSGGPHGPDKSYAVAPSGRSPSCVIITIWSK